MLPQPPERELTEWEISYRIPSTARKNNKWFLFMLYLMPSIVLLGVIFSVSAIYNYIGSSSTIVLSPHIDDSIFWGALILQISLTFLAGIFATLFSDRYRTATHQKKTMTLVRLSILFVWNQLAIIPIVYITIFIILFIVAIPFLWFA